MDFNEALRRYRNGRFTDDDVTRCTDLSVRAWRELIKNRAVRTITENRGRGRVRLCDAIALKRAAAISALNQAGFSLGVSGQIAYFLPFHTVLYEICDPCTILLQSADVDPNTGLPPRLEKPKADWFDPDKPAKADSKTDWLVEIYDRRFVGIIYGINDQSTIFGDLREDGTSFAAWAPHHARSQFVGSAIAKFAKERLPSSDKFVDFVVEWEDPIRWSKQLRGLGYRYEKHGTDHDQLRLAAEVVARSPLFTTRINITLAIRKALRRYLGVEPAGSNPEERRFR